MKQFLTIHHKIQEAIGMVFIIISLIVAVIMMSVIKEPVPTHWDATGKVDGYGGSGAFLVFPLAMLPAVLIMIVCTHLLPIRLWNFPVKPNPGREALIYRDSAYLVTLYSLEMGIFTLLLTIGMCIGNGDMIAAISFILIGVMVVTFIGVVVKCKRDNR